MHFVRLFVGILLGLFLMTGCGSDGGNGPTPDPDPMVNLADLRQSMAISTMNQQIVPSYERLAEQSEALVSALNAFNRDGTDEKLDAMRSALLSTWEAWQSAAIYQMGPTETNALRTVVNIYPTDVALIESNISAGTWTLGTLANRSAEGLPAIDYLLNAESVSSTTLKNTSARMSYLHDLIHRVNDKCQKTLGEWKSSSFSTQFTSDASSGTDVGSALGLLINAMDLHLQRYLRDGKVAIPAGVRSAGVPRPLTVEALYSGQSKSLLISAIDAYIDLIDGAEGAKDKSLSAYLKAIDKGSLSTDMIKKLEAAKDQAALLADSFQDQINSDNQKMVDLFLTLQEVVTLLKSDVASATGISITNQDTDGD